MCMTGSQLGIVLMCDSHCDVLCLFSVSKSVEAGETVMLISISNPAFPLLLNVMLRGCGSAPRPVRHHYLPLPSVLALHLSVTRSSELSDTSQTTDGWQFGLSDRALIAATISRLFNQQITREGSSLKGLNSVGYFWLSFTVSEHFIWSRLKWERSHCFQERWLVHTVHTQSVTFWHNLVEPLHLGGRKPEKFRKPMEDRWNYKQTQFCGWRQ